MNEKTIYVSLAVLVAFGVWGPLLIDRACWLTIIVDFWLCKHFGHKPQQMPGWVWCKRCAKLLDHPLMRFRSERLLEAQVGRLCGTNGEFWAVERRDMETAK